MEKFEWYHFLLFVYVFYIYRRSIKSKPGVTDNFLSQFPVVKNLKLQIFLLCIIPLVLLSSKFEKIPVEKTFALLVSVMAFRSLQYHINERQNLDFIFPSAVVLSLMFLKYELIARENIASIYSYHLMLASMLLLNRQTDTNQVINDLVLVHAMFYIFK